MNQLMMHKLHIAASLIVGLSFAHAALADKLVVKSGEGQLERPNVKVKTIEGDQLVFDSSTGNESRQALSSIIRIEITGEAAFNAAEESYAAEKWSEAADGYNKASRGAAKEWMKDRIGLRQVDLAAKTGRFDVASAGYISLVARNPALASGVKPALPADKESKELTAAVAEIDKALGDSKLATDRRVTLLNFKLEIQSHRGDKQAAGEVVEQILKVGPLNMDDPVIVKQAARLKVGVAQLALEGKDYAKALKEIESSRDILTEPDLQADALFIIAECNYQQALAAKKTDKTLWQDIAISFMRVVAHFGTSPKAPDALARAAACYEQMKDNPAAIKVYEQVVRDYAQSPAAKDAKAAVDRLKAGT